MSVFGVTVRNVHDGYPGISDPSQALYIMSTVNQVRQIKVEVTSGLVRKKGIKSDRVPVQWERLHWNEARQPGLETSI